MKNIWIKQLIKDWKSANYLYFTKRMYPPNIEIIPSKNILGMWQGNIKRTISISEDIITNYPWNYTVEILYHEMAHQYVDEILGVTDETPHGKIFKRVCIERGFDYSASGNIEEWIKSKSVANAPINSLMDKVHKLLALAKSSNENEAQSAMLKAQDLIEKHNILLMEEKTESHYVIKQIGELGRRNPAKAIISTIVSKFFFCEAIWVYGFDQKTGKEGRILEIYGTNENVDIASYVHDYLHMTTKVLWIDYKTRNKLYGNKFRRSFIYGLLNGFYEKLEKKQKTNESLNLILIGDERLKEFYRKRNPKISKSRYSYTKSSTDAYNSGFSKGKNLVINKGVSGNNGNRGFLLG